MQCRLACFAFMRPPAHQLGDWTLRLLCLTLAITPVRQWIGKPALEGVMTMLKYGGKFDNTLFKDDPDGCAFHFANGNDSPNGCKISSFTTLDLTAKYRFTNKAELFATIQNVFDKEPPLDPLTYGAAGYNPLDYSGAVGRYSKIGVRHQF